MAKIVLAPASQLGRRALAILLALALSALIVLPACSPGEGAPASPGEGASADSSLATYEVTVDVAADEAAGLAGESVPVTVPDGASAFDALEASGLDFSASDGDYGKFVESICGVAGTDSTAWVYTVNGEEALVGCADYLLEPGDVVEWLYISW